MKLRAALLAVAGLLPLLAASASGGSLFDLILPGNDLETFTVTDFSEEGRQRRQPTPDKPVYYVAVSAGYVDLGGYKAGERPMPREQMNTTVMKALAKQGFLPVPPGKTPDLIVIWKWGTMNTVLSSLTSNGSGPITVQVNEAAIQRFLGGAKLGLVGSGPSAFVEYNLSPGLRFASGPAEALLSAARDDLYVAAISAYDWKPDKKGRPVQLWNTRIGAPSRGFWMPTALPAMVAIATPFIGRETDQPVWIKAADHYKPDIKIGDPTVIAYLEKSKTVVENVGQSN